MSDNQPNTSRANTPAANTPAANTPAANTRRATTRPAHVKPPAHWVKSDPPPSPEKGDADETHSPTRYGDWESKGIAVDF